MSEETLLERDTEYTGRTQSLDGAQTYSFLWLLEDKPATLLA